jgi:hypothetical protein
MATDADPIVGNWYAHRTEKGQKFEVIAIDEDDGVVEVQHYDGDVEAFDIDDWYQMDLDVIEAPENWTGPMDGITDEDLVYMDSDMGEDEWKQPLQENRQLFRQDDEAEEPGQAPPIPDERLDEEEGRGQRK